jgi:hypothetical protein
MGVFNAERYLAGAVESILNQSFRDFEFIVIDDGSTDGSGAILDAYQLRDSRLRVYHQQNRGLTESLNRGCALARGKYIARMDADDIAIKDRLMWQVDFMESHPKLAVLGGAVEWIDATGKALSTHQVPVEPREIKSALLARNVFWHSTVLMRREAFALAGGYRGVAADAEDYDLWLRLSDVAELANLGVVVLQYRIHPFQVSIRKRTQQTLTKLAVQAAALSRREGSPDPLNGIESITPAVLAGLGVNEARLWNELAGDQLQWVKYMYAAGQFSTALMAAVEFLKSDMAHVDRWLIADLQLAVARLYWREGSFAKGLLAACQAILTRPTILGRPLRPLFARFGLAG